MDCWTIQSSLAIMHFTTFNQGRVEEASESWGEATQVIFLLQKFNSYGVS